MSPMNAARGGGQKEVWKEKQVGSGRNLVNVCPIGKYDAFIAWTLTNITRMSINFVFLYINL